MNKHDEDHLIREAFFVLAEAESEKLCLPPLEETSQNLKFRTKINKLIAHQTTSKTTSISRQNFWLTCQRALTKAAIVVFALLIVGFLSANDVSALRQTLVDFKKEEYGKGTAYITSQRDTRVQVNNQYELTYLPDNLTENGNEATIGYYDWEFLDERGNFLAVTISSVNTTVAIDNENVDKQYSVEIMGEQADVVVKDEFVSVIWFKNDVLFSVYGYIPEKEIIRVAKNIIIIEERVIR